MKFLRKSLTSLLKPSFWVSIFYLTLILFPLPSYALTVQDVPNPRQEYGGWVMDLAEMLTPQGENQLNQMISDLESQNGTEIAIVTVPDTRPYATPKKFTTQLFNSWRIGKQGQDNGLLLMVSKGDRRVEIETGYGLEAILPDAKVGNIIRSKIVPRFKQGDFAGGIVAGTQALIGNITANDELIASGTSDRPWFSHVPIYIWLISSLGLGWSLVSYILLLLIVNRPLGLNPSEKVDREQNDALIVSYNLQPQPAYQQFLVNYQQFLVKRYLQVFNLSVSLAILIIAYLISWKFRVMALSGLEFALSFSVAALISFVGLLVTNEVSSLAVGFWSFLYTLFALTILQGFLPTDINLLIAPLLISISNFLVMRQLFAPEKITLVLKSLSRRLNLFKEIEVVCNQCGSRMEELALNEIKAYLDRPQQVAQQLGSSQFFAWKCRQCQPQLSFFSNIHLRSYFTTTDPNNPERTFEHCHICKELTVLVMQKEISAPTYDKEGKRLIEEECQCCNYQKQTYQSIPKKGRFYSSSSSSSDWGSSDDLSRSGSDFGGGDSDFGGGDSGGGGAGGDW